jgi:hypothetical protein
MPSDICLYLMAITELGLSSGSAVGEEHEPVQVGDCELLGPTHWGNSVLQTVQKRRPTQPTSEYPDGSGESIA